MKVAYLFITPRAATYKLAQMILPQLEAGMHGVEVVGGMLPRPVRCAGTEPTRPSDLTVASGAWHGHLLVPPPPC